MNDPDKTFKVSKCTEGGIWNLEFFIEFCIHHAEAKNKSESSGMRNG